MGKSSGRPSSTAQTSPLVYRQVSDVIGLSASGNKSSGQGPDVRGYVRRDAQCCRFIHVTVYNQMPPARLKVRRSLFSPGPHHGGVSAHDVKTLTRGHPPAGDILWNIYLSAWDVSCLEGEVMEIARDVSTLKVNTATAEVVKAYLEYTSSIVTAVIESKSYSTPFKDIGDELIITPDELIELINRVQKAFVSTKD
jgi:hypothetical protein